MIIYTSSNAWNPNTVIGPTWVRIEGKFLLGATDRGSTGTNILKTASVALNGSGGEAEHKLTGKESGLQDHRHNSNGLAASSQVSPYTWNFAMISDNGQRQAAVQGSGNKDASETHNNMPPFRAVIIWERTA